MLPWADLEVPGVSMKVRHKDEATGAMAVLNRMRTGAVIPAHWHTKADETVFVLDGDFVEEGEGYGQGQLLPGQGRNEARAAFDGRGCTVLTHFSAELDFQTGQVPATR